MGMREEVEEVKQAIAAGRATKEQGAAYLEMKAKEINPEAYGTLAQNAAASQAGDDGMSFVGVSRPKGPPPGPVQFQQAGTPATGLSPEQILAQDAGVMSTGPTEPIQMRGSTEMGRTPPGIMGANVGPGPSTMPQERLPTLMNESGMPPQMAGGQPRPVPAMPPQGLLEQGMGGLRSMGRSLGAGAKSLFNDPSRMAMLQGGLSMMDPNSYYDKQGFGSVFTGLNQGLGAAQAGHKGVLDRRKTAAETAKLGLGTLTNPKVVDIGGGMSQMYQGGQKVGAPFKASDTGTLPTAAKYKELRDKSDLGSDEWNYYNQLMNKASFVPSQFPTTNTNIYKVDPNFTGTGPNYKVESLIKKGNKPVTQKEVLEGEAGASSAGRAVQNVGQLFSQLSVTGDVVGGELFGDNVISNWNTFVDNIGISSLGSDARRKIDAFQNALKRDLPRAFLADDKSKSNFDKKLVLDSMGYDGQSSRDKKMRAMPDAIGLTYENYAKNAAQAGQDVLPLREYLEKNDVPEALIKMVESKAAKGSVAGDIAPSGYKRGSNNHLFRKKGK